VKRAAFTNVLLLGMGGSSLGPEVSALTFGNQSGWPTLRIPRFDRSGTDQGDRSRDRHDANAVHRVQQVRQHERAERAEGLFFARSSRRSARTRPAANRRVADPGYGAGQDREADRFRGVFLGQPNIGGPYSVLSPFGLVPAAASGVDVARLLETAQAMVRSCGDDVPPADNPAVQLGVAGREERDKVTLFSSPKLVDFGAWAEQRRIDRKE
jgi:transaldolase/glucose-6-phosphate isomerase